MSEEECWGRRLKQRKAWACGGNWGHEVKGRANTKGQGIKSHMESYYLTTQFFKKRNVRIIEHMINDRRMGIFKVKGLGMNEFRGMEYRRD